MSDYIRMTWQANQDAGFFSVYLISKCPGIGKRVNALQLFLDFTLTWRIWWQKASQSDRKQSFLLF